MMYVEPSGALGYTQAHSDDVPEGVTVGGFIAYEKGYFLVAGTETWMACPATASQQANGQEYQIFAPLPGGTFSPFCFPLELLTVDWDQSQGPAAWEYT